MQKFEFKDGDEVVFTGADLDPKQKDRLLRACKRVCLEKGWRTNEQLTRYLTDRLNFIGRNGVVFITGLPARLQEVSGGLNRSTAKSWEFTHGITPKGFNCDAFLIIISRRDPKLPPRPGGVAVLPVMFEEIAPKSVVFKGASL